jgi:outer membrane protein assembly factor BamE
MRAYYDALGDLALPSVPCCATKPGTRSRVEAQRPMRKFTILAIILTGLALASGCVYRANISQGNLIDQKDLDKVAVGMTRNQVRFLLGTPMIDDPFHAQRWDYVYYLKIGRKDATFKRWVSVFFEDNAVSEIRKDQTLDPGL